MADKVKVKLLVARAGTYFAQQPGDIIEVPKDEAKRLIESQQAAPLGKAEKRETPEKRQAKREKRG